MKSLVLVLILASMVSLSQAQESRLTLVSDVWDYIPHVEITEGYFGDAAQNSLVYSGPVSRGDTFTVTLVNAQQCYRRSGNPYDPNSQLTEWRCNSNLLSDPEEWSLN